MPIKEVQSQLQSIEALVNRIENVADPALKATAKELVQSLMELHGAGIERMLEIVRQDATSGSSIIEALVRDDHVRSLLLIYGLHPDSLETRVTQALEKTRPYLKSHGGNVNLVGVDDSGTVTLRLEGNCHGCPSSSATLKLAVEEAIYEAAPDVTAILVQGDIQEVPATTLGFVPLSQLGFIVIEVGARGGSPQRDKWYDSYGYGNLRDYGLADKKVAAERLAAMHPYIDLSRVGMWGHSGGGFMTAAALMQYPDFYKAGWSESGNHDNNVYNRDWSEKYHGVREEMQKDGTEKFIYEIDKNSDLAKNLKGHLMLTTGDMDENVSMVNTMHLANALIKADKRFELQIYPGMRHPYMPIVSYVDMARGDFFAHWLLGSYDTRADILELQNQKQATPSKKFKE